MAKISKTESGYQDPGEQPKEQVERREGNWLSRTIRSLRRSKRGKALDDAKMKDYGGAQEIAKLDPNKMDMGSAEKHEDYMVKYAIAAAVNKDYDIAGLFANKAGYYRSGAYQEIALQAVRDGNIDKAIEYAEKIPDDETGDRGEAFQQIFLSLIDNGMVTDEVLNNNAKLGNSDKTLDELADKTGKFNKTYRDAVRFALRLKPVTSTDSEKRLKQTVDLELAKKLRDKMSEDKDEYHIYIGEVNNAISEYEKN